MSSITSISSVNQPAPGGLTLREKHEIFFSQQLNGGYRDTIESLSDDVYTLILSLIGQFSDANDSESVIGKIILEAQFNLLMEAIKDLDNTARIEKMNNLLQHIKNKKTFCRAVLLEQFPNIRFYKPHLNLSDCLNIFNSEIRERRSWHETLYSVARRFSVCNIPISRPSELQNLGLSVGFSRKFVERNLVTLAHLEAQLLDLRTCKDLEKLTELEAKELCDQFLSPSRQEFV